MKPGPVLLAKPSRRKRRNGTPLVGRREDAATAAGGSESSGLGGRVAKHEAADAIGPAQRQLLGDHPAHREPDHRRRAETEVVDEAAGIGSQVGDRVRPRGMA